MLAFDCARCGQLVFFENSECLRCHAPLGFVPDRRRIVTFAPDDDGTFVELFGSRTRFRRCANSGLAACNWMVPADGPGLCGSCRLTRTRPGDGSGDALVQFAAAEAAKRRLVFQVLDLGLPVVPATDATSGGVAFDLLSSTATKVVTGHDDGLITLDLAESDDAHRETVRHSLGEPYRTLLGHFRHEIGHYYWTMLIADVPDRVGQFRALFGDERADYGESLQRHYADGAPDDWRRSFVSTYATMHPWEDWAETFAHYLHIRDTLQTAGEFGMRIDGPDLDLFGADASTYAVVSDGDVDDEPFAAIVARWLPLTYALNAVNRSMGRDDLYPFVLVPRVVAKLSFVHGCVTAPVAVHT